MSFSQLVSRSLWCEMHRVFSVAQLIVWIVEYHCSAFSKSDIAHQSISSHYHHESDLISADVVYVALEK